MNAPLHYRKVMLIDDSKDEHVIFGTVLHSIDPAIIFITAWNGEDALNVLNLHTDFLPDLIFLDISMPRINGFECLRRIKQNPVLNHIPVAMYSTLCSLEEQMKARLLGAAWFLPKLHVNELEEVMAYLVMMEKPVKTPEKVIDLAA